MEKKRLADLLMVVALTAALAVVIARSTVSEGPREDVRPSAEKTTDTHGMGAAAGLTLDLIACIPALLALAARAAEPESVNKQSLACGLALMLGAWVAASCCWADDKFSAIVHACHFCAGLCILWAASQCVVTPARLRVVAAAAFGLLLLNLVQAVQWRFIEMPQTVKFFEDHKEEYLRKRGWKPDDFMAKQFESKILHKEMLGFTNSSNSFAAVLVLLGGVSAGLSIQLLRDGETMRGAIVAAVIPVTGFILYFTQSKAALVTPLLFAGLMLIAWRCKRFLRQKGPTAYAIGAGIVIVGLFGAIAFGLIFHRLPGASLNFRWRYWTASWQLFLSHPLAGVGWNNFGAHYLHFRLPVAAEEIQDPHNFLVRFATETGIVGALLAAAWIARLWWEMTQYPCAEEEPAGRAGVIVLFGAVIGGLILGGAAGIDFTPLRAFISQLFSGTLSDDSWQQLAFPLLQIFNRLIWFVALATGVWIAAVKPDRRPAPWILYAILAAAAAFLAHNLIEFSLFEPGPEMLFALLVGSALGMRCRAATTTVRSAVGWLIGGAIAWTVAILLVIPIIPAEAAADAGDDSLSAGNYGAAADHYAEAVDLVDYNADYLFRQALAEEFRPNGDSARVRSLLAAAIAADPSAIRFRQLRAEIEAKQRDAAGMRADYEAVLVLNPNEVSIRREYAKAMIGLFLLKEAEDQLDLALKYNDLLPMEEPKRVPDGLIRGEFEQAFLFWPSRIMLGATDGPIRGEVQQAIQAESKEKPAG